MKNNIYSLLAILFFLSSCQSKFDKTLNEVDKTLAQTQEAQPGFSNIRLFTTERSLSPSSTKQLMKTSIDYNTQFDKIGILLFLENYAKEQKTFQELATVDLSTDKDADAKYVGRKIFSLTENKFPHDVHSVLVKLISHETEDEKTITAFNLKSPNSYPHGIKHFERNNIREDEIILLDCFDERTGTGYERRGYHGKLVLRFYDSTKKEDLLEQMDWNLNAILSNHSTDQLILPNLITNSEGYHGQDSNFQGFTFGEDGE